jgi:hypothetical protein
MAQLCKYVERMWTPNLYGAVGASDGVTSLCLVELFGDFGLYVFFMDFASICCFNNK